MRESLRLPICLVVGVRTVKVPTLSILIAIALITLIVRHILLIR